MFNPFGVGKYLRGFLPSGFTGGYSSSTPSGFSGWGTVTSSAEARRASIIITPGETGR